MTAPLRSRMPQFALQLGCSRRRLDANRALRCGGYRPAGTWTTAQGYSHNSPFPSSRDLRTRAEWDVVLLGDRRQFGESSQWLSMLPWAQCWFSGISPGGRSLVHAQYCRNGLGHARPCPHELEQCQDRGNASFRSSDVPKPSSSRRRVQNCLPRS
jgi:hypothetical protein